MPNFMNTIRQRVAALPRQIVNLPNTIRDNSLVFTRLYNISKGFWVDSTPIKTGYGIDPRLWMINILHVAGILCLLYINARINVYISECLKHYMSAIQELNPAEQAIQLRHFLWALGCISVVQVANNLAQTWLSCHWRNWLTNNLFGGYYANFAWAKLQRRPDIDNPDQRMTDNVGAFCGLTVTLFLSLIDSALNIYLWSQVLWGISHDLTWTVFGWATFGSVVVIVIGKVLVPLANKLNESEGSLRFALQETRREADAIALYQGEDVARQNSSKKLKTVTDTILTIAFRYVFLQLFTTPFNGLVPWIAPFFIAPLFAHNLVEFGTIAQAQAAVIALYGALNLLSNRFGDITGFAAVINRLGSLKEAMDEYAAKGGVQTDSIQVTDGSDIVFDNVTIKSDDGIVVVDKLNLMLKKGESVCILGRSSTCAQIVRTLGRVWDSGSGKLLVPPREEIMFLTQSPYLPEMTLRQAIGFPCNTCGEDDQVLKVLRIAQLDHLVKKFGLDTVQNWNTLLLSERQRLSLARIMFKNPDNIVVEEATSVLEPDTERMFYALLANTTTTIVSCVSKPDLAKFHNWVLTLSDDGTWKLQKASEFTPPEPAK
jgi:putative ATP-binding cassette transporter